MLSAGAYSKKFQSLEKEHMRKLEESNQQVLRTAREKALFLSRQTSQRQRAMEERKKAALEAEEQRRKKALEERRRAQLEATERFKVAMGRMKSAPKKPRSRDIEIFIPNRVTPLAQKNMASRQQSERVVYDSDVELRSTSHQRVSSLDDILRSVRCDSHEDTASRYTEREKVQQQAFCAASERTSIKSASDMSLAENGAEDTVTPTESHTLHLQAFLPEETACGDVEAECPAVFVPVPKSISQPLPSLTKDDVRVTSPDINESDYSSPEDSLCDVSLLCLQDSLDLREQQLASSAEPNAMPAVKEPPPTFALQCTYKNGILSGSDQCDDDGSDSSSVESTILFSGKAVPNSMKDVEVALQTTLHGVGGTTQTTPHSTLHSVGGTTQTTPQAKLVGILKKTPDRSQPAKTNGQKPSADVPKSAKKVRFSDQALGFTLTTHHHDDNNNPAEQFSFLSHTLGGQRNSCVIPPGGVMSPFPHHYLFTPKIRLLMNQQSSQGKPGSGTITVDPTTAHLKQVVSKGATSADTALEDTGYIENLVESAKCERGRSTKGSTQDTDTLAPNQSQPEPKISNPSTVEGLEPTDGSPTDEDINRVWTQIRTYVQDMHKPNGCVALSETARQPVTTSGNSVIPPTARDTKGSLSNSEQRTFVTLTSREAPDLSRKLLGSQKQLTQRPSSKPTRCQVEPSDWKTKGVAKPSTGSNDPQTATTGPISLLLEEQRVLQSLEKLNQRLVVPSTMNGSVPSTLGCTPHLSEFQGPYFTNHLRTRMQSIQNAKATRPDVANIVSIRYK